MDPWTAGCGVLVGVFAMSTLEKTRRLIHRTAHWHPIVLHVTALRRFPRLFLAASGVADAATVLLLLGRPRVGAAGAAALVVVYTPMGMIGIRRPSAEDCGCIGRTLDARTPAGFVVRNVILLLIGAASAVGQPAPIGEYASLASSTVLLAAVEIGTLVVIVHALDRAFAELARGGHGGPRERVLPTKA